MEGAGRVIEFEVYQGRRRQGGRAQLWRWRARAGNNRIIATSGEAFTNQADAERAAAGLAHFTDATTGVRVLGQAEARPAAEVLGLGGSWGRTAEIELS